MVPCVLFELMDVMRDAESHLLVIGAEKVGGNVYVRIMFKVQIKRYVKKILFMSFVPISSLDVFEMNDLLLGLGLAAGRSW